MKKLRSLYYILGITYPAPYAKQPSGRCSHAVRRALLTKDASLYTQLSDEKWNWHSGMTWLRNYSVYILTAFQPVSAFVLKSWNPIASKEKNIINPGSNM